MEVVKSRWPSLAPPPPIPGLQLSSTVFWLAQYDRPQATFCPQFFRSHCSGVTRLLLPAKLEPNQPTQSPLTRNAG